MTFTGQRLFAFGLATAYLVAPRYSLAADPELRVFAARPPLEERIKAAALEAISPQHRLTRQPVDLPLQSLSPDATMIYKSLLPSASFIVTTQEDANGQSRVVSSGSGWVIDHERQLVVTNHHVVGLARTAKVYFPVAEGKHMVTERSRYLAEFAPITGTVFLDEPDRDLMVLKLDRLPDECAAVPLADDSPSPGEAIYSVGNPGISDALFVFSAGIVRQVYRRKFSYADGQRVDARIIETQSPVNPGDSGGPVVNTGGKLVGVVASQTRGEVFNIFIDVSEVKALVQDIDELWAPTTAQQYYRRGLQSSNRADYERAIRDFDEALHLDPKYSAALAKRGECYLQRHDLDTAAADLHEAAAVDSNCAEAHRGLASLALKREQWQSAVQEATQAIRLDSKEFQGYYYRGVAHFNLKEYRLAAPDLEQAQKLDSTGIGALYLAKTRYALQDFRGAVEAYKQAIDLDPHLIEIYQDLSEKLRAERAFSYAIEYLTIGINNNPTNYELFFLRALSYESSGQFDLALSDLNVTVLHWPSDPWIHAMRGIVYEDLREFDQAASDYRDAVRLDPNVSAFRLALAKLLFRIGRLGEADEHCDIAVALDNTNAEAHLVRAVIHFALGQPRSVIDADIRLAGRLNPQFAKAVVGKYKGKHVVFANLSGETIEVSAYFRGPGVDGELHWYPATRGQGRPIVFTVPAHKVATLSYQGQFASAVEFSYSARGTVTGAALSGSSRTSSDAGYIWFERQSVVEPLVVK